mmetsp:Transcript_126045/g.351214  ORF Transcript_126045/g.351214 Transcript_126045/m.351214 type:complete len:756 (-) Transcript_126045:441-2708(-)
MSVVFQVECRETRPGDGVFLIGSHDALGSWSPALAPSLTTTAETFPSWTSEAIALPVGTPVQFKFVVQREDRTGSVTWETLQETNRTVTPSAGRRTTARTSWGTAKTECSTQPEPAASLSRTRTEELLAARMAQERKLLRMAESAVDAAAAEAPKVSEVATTLMMREDRRRNFSQSLLRIGADALTDPVVTPDAAEDAGRPSGEAPVVERGVPLKHITSFSALSTMAEAAEKDEARRAHKAQSHAQYEPNNLEVPVVVVTSEFAPWSKTGGLGLVTASYSYEFPRTGHRTMVVSPKYKHFEGISQIGETRVLVNGREELVKYWYHFTDAGDGRGCDCVFVDHPSIERKGGLYSDDDGREYPDNLFRFTLLSLAAMEAPLILKLGGCAYGDKVVFLANDWQSGLVPLYMYYKYRPHGTYSQARVIYIVHNLGYQGQYHGYEACHFFGVSEQGAADVAFGDCVNLSKGALICADRVITVSPNYANEIQTPEGGFSLQDFVRAKAHALRLTGILNGIDDCWNPQTDKHIAFNYSVENFEEGKAKNKAELQKQLGLMEDPHCVLIGFVGRLTWQKGVDVIGSSISWLMADTGNGVTGHAQLIMMGNGQREYADTLRWAEGNFRGRVCGYVGFDPKVEHQIMAGCDLFLMPSRYEPCGLPQMYSQQYGTLPIVTATGGLKDTVKDLSKGPAEATGFQISHLNPDKLKEVIYRAAELILRRPAEFRCMQRTAMRTDFYWRRAIDEYERHIDFTLYDPPATR